MADKNIGALDPIENLDDDSMLPVEQQGVACRVSGKQIRGWAESAVDIYVESAKEAAEQATTAAQEASGSAEQAQTSASEAETAKNAAQQAQSAAEASEKAATESEVSAAESATQASQSEASAAESAGAAEQARQDAEAAQAAAEAAETAAKNSADSASASETAAAESAASASTDAETAKTAAEDASDSAETAKEYSGNPAIPQDGTWWIWNTATQQYEDTGIASVLTIVKSYPSVADMEADFDNMHTTDLVIIQSGTEDPDNSKLYVRTDTEWLYLSDLSGLQGVGIEKIEQTSGDHHPGTSDSYTIYLTDGSTYTIEVYNGADGEGAGDMRADIYDPEGHYTDIFWYTDNQINVHQPIVFTITLKADAWEDDQQIIEDDRFIADGYAYIISPDDETFDDYDSIRGLDITEDGKMVFILTGTEPDVDLIVDVMRMEVTDYG